MNARPRPKLFSGRRPPWGRYGLRATAIIYLGLFIAVPIAVIARRGFAGGARELAHALMHPVAQSALLLTLECAAIMAVINATMGTLIAYVLVRYRFPGRNILNLLIDLPFSIPTLVAGLMIVVLFGPAAPLGRAFSSAGIEVLYAPPAIVLALLFVTLPIVVRAVEPVLAEVDVAEEEAAQTLGASDVYTFRKVILPAIFPAIVTGTLLGFARALGELGSIIVVGGNLPRKSLVASVYIFGEVESGNNERASAMSLVLVAISFFLLLVAAAYEKKMQAKHA
ncbi:MAG: sulfate ABC transporter permease subunit [Polyangiaceae bacterium]|nr:sulfate ABC transporter permease subunit [Polyangiaceae bacterium]